MPYVKRDDQGKLVAISVVPGEDFAEEIEAGSLELTSFLAQGNAANSLDSSDQDFVRVLEDVVGLLIDKGVILFTELPNSAQEKIMRRQQLRSKLGDKLDLIGDD